MIKNDKINSLKAKYIKAENREVKARANKEKCKTEMVNEVLLKYGKRDTRNRLINDVKENHFSEEKTKHIEIIFSDEKFNQDNITIDDVNDITDAEKFLKQQKHESILSKIANIIPDGGEN